MAQRIFHITPRACWLQQQAGPHYRAASLSTEGFIHCSTREQLVESADLHFCGQSDLVVLCIAAQRVSAAIRYEDLSGRGVPFPHIYGSLNVEAVVDVLPLPPAPDGTFRLPCRILDDGGG